VLGPSGKVIEEGHISLQDGWVAQSLKDVVMLEPPKVYGSAKLDRAIKACKWGDFKAASYDLAHFAKEKGDDAEASQKLLAWIDELGTKKLAEGDAAREAGDFFGARDAYALLEQKWVASADYVKTAHEKAADLAKNEDAKKAFSQEKTFAGATAAEKAGDRTKAATLWKKLVDACPGSKFTEWCQAKANALDGK